MPLSSEITLYNVDKRRLRTVPYIPSSGCLEVKFIKERNYLLSLMVFSDYTCDKGNHSFHFQFLFLVHKKIHLSK